MTEPLTVEGSPAPENLLDMTSSLLLESSRCVGTKAWLIDPEKTS